MDATTATLLAGAVGAILGAGGSVLTVLIQSSYQRKRETLRLATEVAIRDREKMIELARESGRPYKQLPLVIYLHYHVKLIELIESGDFDEASYEALVAENHALGDQVERMNARKREQGPPEARAPQS